MLHTNLVFVFDSNGRILLSMKKRGFGAGRWNGAGGKAQPGEDMVAAAARELEEETLLTVPTYDFEPMGVLHFRFPHKSDWNQECSVFRVVGYAGADPAETEEMRPQWYDIEDIPYASMWPDDIYWLPDLIEGKRFEWTFVFDEVGEIAKKTNHLFISH